ncbi:hypothetical protein [Sporomusa acidovorans]|uniref:Uncharacterized protein n=1 Tax=Sporomusa acidovorans (strain ATCC 49682 / DSM 3132 / Mol) TaxID=1123286 RepID=A0ABZ3J971_SPOA4|nr:hypothetical protein [Sporomusa acidovorans]OZC22959.1 hypothetical protein SPACI_10320 [Sporomusa acidovorans DSM 3132]SDE93951.1 hypothetical protein SAMN04488499_102721 [Sporomusa acidovorans]
MEVSESVAYQYEMVANLVAEMIVDYLKTNPPSDAAAKADGQKTKQANSRAVNSAPAENAA